MGNLIRIRSICLAVIACVATLTIVSTLARSAFLSASEYTFDLLWAAPRSGDGRFKHSQDLAIDAAGCIYASDYPSNRIQKLASEGVLVTTGGGFENLPGQRFGAEAMAVDATGDAHVAQISNDRRHKHHLVALACLPKSGPIGVSDIWGGEICVTGDVTVMPGTTLTILPETLIRFAAHSDDTAGGEDTSRSELIVQGTLVAQGTSDQMITFTSAAATAMPGDWAQIAFEVSSSGSVVSHSRVEYALRGIKSRSSVTTIGPGNIIARNMYNGVEVDGSGTIGNVITQNRFFDSGAKGIHLALGANGGIGAPVVAGISVGPMRVTGTACTLCTVEVFANRDTDGEGETYVGSTTANGSGDFVLTLAGPLGKPFLTATATDPISGTSEFSAVFDSEIRSVFLPVVFKNY